MYDCMKCLRETPNDSDICDECADEDAETVLAADRMGAVLAALIPFCPLPAGRTAWDAAQAVIAAYEGVKKVTPL